MNEAIRFRRALAQSVADAYGANEAVALVLLTGSVARELADQHSDVELHVFWSAPPSAFAREQPFVLAAASERQLWPLEDDEWSDRYLLSNLQFDLNHVLVATGDAYLHALLDLHEPSSAKQLLIAAITQGHLLHEREAGLHARWLARAARYPEELRRAMVEEHLRPHPRWPQRHALAARGDLVCLHDLLLSTLRTLLSALCGLNGVYVDHPAFKWFSALCARLTLAPERLEERLRELLRAAPDAALAELEALIDESCELVAAQMSEPLAAGARRAFAVQRNS